MLGAFRTAGLFRLDGRIESSLMRSALQQLQQRHPKLRAVIVRGDDGVLRYDFGRPVQPIPFEIKDYDQGEAPFREEARRMLQSEFPAGGPLVMVTVLRNGPLDSSHVILVVHHAIGDGVSAIMLASDLLAAYARAAETHEEQAPEPSLQLVRGARAKALSSWRDRWWLFRRFTRVQGEEKRGRRTPLPWDPEIPPQSQWVLWVFSREETMRLVRRCRSEQTSLVGVLTAAACCGLMDCLSKPQAIFNCQFPFDVRNKLEETVTIQDLGAFASVMNEFYSLSHPLSFWDFARLVHRDIQIFVEHEGPSFYYNLLAYYQRVAGWLSALSRNKSTILTRPDDQRVTLYATNFGVANFRDTYGSLRLREGMIFFKGDIVGPWLIMSSMVIGQRLNLTFAADSIDSLLWEQLQAAVRKYLDMVVNGAPGTVI